MTAGTRPAPAWCHIYSQAPSASGGTAPYSHFTVSAGARPAGLALSSSGTIGGPATAVGTFGFTIAAQDSTSGPAAPYTGSQVCSLTALGPVIAFSQRTLSNATIGVGYNQALTGGEGTYTLHFTADNGIGADATQTFTLTVNQPAAFTSADGTAFAVGSSGSFTVTASGAPAPTLSESNTDTLPSGVTFTPATGVLAGIPAAGSAGTYTLHFTAHNGVGADAVQTFTLTVANTLPPAFTSSDATTFTVATAGNFTVTASGLPAPTLSESNADTLPAGVTFTAGTGILAGTPATGSGGTYALHFTAHNGIGSDATQTFTLTVAQPPAFISGNNASFTEGASGAFTVSANGTPVPTLTELAGDTLPSGVTFTPATGVLAGTPAAGSAGAYTLHFSAHNGIGSDAAQTFTLTVSPASFSLDTATKTLTITANAASNNFSFSQATTEDGANTLHTTYKFTLNGVTQTFTDSQVVKVLVNGLAGSNNTAILVTSDTYVDNNGQTQETPESVALGSKADAGVGTIQKDDANGNPHPFLTLDNFPISYAYVGRNDGTVNLFGTAGVPYNGFVSAGNYSYIGGPGLFHLAQGASSVYGYSAGQATDFAYHYTANAGSAFVVSGTAFSYVSTNDTVNGATRPYFNVAVGFPQNTGVSRNPGQDFAYIIDSPANDTFVGGTAYSFMYSTGAGGSFTEFDAAYAFAIVYGESFVGGFDTATNGDPNKNILAGFGQVHG